MKIGVYTHTLGNNYGGLLQAWALQKTLQSMGHEVWILQHDDESLRIKVLKQIRKIVFPLIRRFYVTDQDKRYICSNTYAFIEKYIQPRTNFLSPSELHYYLKQNAFDVVVVGSDQVWRPMYVGNIKHFFLDFAEDLDIKRISYAASFGVDTWEINSAQTKACKRLVQQFDAISVRESSGVDLCKQYLDKNAVQVLDPTLLHEKKEYESIVKQENEPRRNGGLFCYVLDKSEESQEIVRMVSTKTRIEPYYCMPRNTDYAYMTRNNKDDFVYPRVITWLRSFMDAEMIITDSFHGVVFSIIFNKPFWVIVNKKRGAARFESLLKIFGLENRMIIDNNKNCSGTTDCTGIDWNEPIDWDRVNEIKKRWQDKSLEFLKESL